jgi:hypothetical protein
MERLKNVWTMPGSRYQSWMVSLPGYGHQATKEGWTVSRNKFT